MVDQPDPIDRAYAKAETLLDDEAARAARRAKVLAAVAQDAVTAPASDTKPAPRFIPRGGWLVAASLLLASYLGVRFLVLNPPEPSHLTVQASSAAKNQRTALLSPPVAPSAPANLKPAVPDLAPARIAPPKALPHQQLAMAAPPAASLPAFEVATAPPPAPMAAPPPAAAARAFAAPPAAPPPVMAAPAAPPPPVADLARSSDVGAFEHLRAAAAAGRTSEVQALLDRQIPVDGADADGETALMKSIKADQPETAALLIRHGASLDKKNHAGQSARDLATQMHDPALNRALGLEP